MSFVANLDTKLLSLSPSDHFTLRDACNGVHVFGGIGSGKTTGTGATLAGAYLRAGMGGLVLCAKPEEVGLWLSYAKKHGRSRSVVVFDDRRDGFNFIAWELARQGVRGIGSIVDCLMRVLESADAATGITGNTSDAFWPQSIRQALNYTLPLLYSAWGTVTVASVIDFVTSAATKAEQYLDQAWAQNSYAARTLRQAVDAPAVPMVESERNGLLEYWFRAWPAVPDKTRGNILVSISAKLDRFKHGRLRDCFCGKTDILPEMTFHGAIIIMAMPALTWNEDGIVGQQLFKYMWQRAVESRNGLPKRQRERPVFLWADEAQYFVNVKDEEFLSTCRGSRACVVFMTQTLPTYYARLGKDKTDAADGLVGKFSTQVFHANACNRTNTFASQLIGRGIQRRATQGASVGTNTSSGMNDGGNAGSGSSTGNGSTYGSGLSWNNNSGRNKSSGESWGQNVGRGRNENQNWSTSEQMDYLVEPRFFATALKSGGPASRNLVTAVWVKAGGNFRDSDEGNVLYPVFRQ